MKKLLTLLSSIAVLFFFSGSGVESEKEIPLYKNPNNPVEDRIEDLLKRMTLEEKISLLGGTGFATKPIERLGIPELRMTDGPVGVRWEVSNSYPSGISMAATWNPKLIYKLGSALAEDTKAKGRNLILGPCVNILRLPHGGRNFESFGEDPYLTSRITVDYIKGVQKENVAACVKHFACNNQEHQRDFVDVKVDERALNEIYLPAFKAAVQEADVLSVMSAYNKVNGPYCSENDYLLVDKLKNEWGFKGLVMSDWGAVHSSVPTAGSGLDLEMPTGKYLNDSTLLDAVKSGDIKESVIDDKIRRILAVMFKLDLFENQIEADSTKIKSTEKSNIAYQTALESIVLLKNSANLLPLDLNKIKSVAVIGANAVTARTGGGGSSYVDPIYSVSPLQALQEKFGDKVKITFQKGVALDGDTDPVKKEFFPGGLKTEIYTNKFLEGKPAIIRTDENINFWWRGGSPSNEIEKDNFSVRWTGKVKAPKSGEFVFDVVSDDGVRFYFEDELVINDWTDHAVLSNSYTVVLEEGREYNIKLEYYEFGGDAVVALGWRLPGENILTEAVNIARQSDVAIVFAGTSFQVESEGFDRKTLELPNKQDEMIAEIVKANKNTIVVLNNGGPVLVSKWINDIPAVLETWFYGQEGGNAIADVLSGSYNPSGKLPMSWPVKWEDCSAFKTYKAMDSTTYYDDGIYVGYRHFEKNNIKPQFPFGFGLSYTTFEYSDLKIDNSDKPAVSFKVKNTGSVNGEEIAQLYVADIKSSVDRPLKELKRFSKISLDPGESKTIEFVLNNDDLSFFDLKTKNWVAEPGEFEVLIGSSSADIKLKDKFTLK